MISSTPLAHTMWQLSSFGLASQSQAASTAALASLAFGDAHVSGSFGCNSFHGGYTCKENILIFQPFATTQRTCDDATSQQEHKMAAGLRGKVRYEVMSNILRIFYNNDQSALTFHAAAVTGLVIYQEQTTLPPNATMIIRLLDLLQDDEPAAVLAEQVITISGQQMPLRFALPFDPIQIVPTNTYSMRAEVHVNEQPLFVALDSILVITQGRPITVEIVLQRVQM